MAESELETSHFAHVMCDMEKDFEFAIGMVFSNEFEAYNKYVVYALSKGFGVRKGNLVRNTKGKITRRTFVCNCEGYSVSSSDQEKKFERFEVRCGCLAHIKFKVDNDVYEVIEYNSEHNHAFVPEDQRHLIRCGRIMSETCKGVLVDMMKADIGGITTYKCLANEAGGSKSLGLQRTRSNSIGGEDCQDLLNHFHSMEQQNPMFSYALQVDQDGRLTNIFWRDSLSKFDYGCFGDVLVFDTIHRTDKCNMICAHFVGVNHHWKNVLFGCAFLMDETVESFIWLFEAFLKSMENKAPKTMFTDQDQVMAKAIRTVFPNTQHRLCTWHIMKNANQNIPHLYHKPGFRDKYFLALVYRCKSEDEFESTWREMKERWDTKDNIWLQRLYHLRHKWSLAFGRDIFTCGMRSSQRSESINNVFQKIGSKTLTLIQFVYYYEKQVKHMREIESQDDYSYRETPKLMVSHDILMHAASVYTGAIFTRFNHEFLQSLSEIIVSSTFDGLIYSYTLKCRGTQREHVVRFAPADSSVFCECKLFESKGWLCRHALKVLIENISVTHIPPAYVLKRWTKGAKQGIANDEFKQMSLDSSKFNRFSLLMQQSFELMNLGAEDDNTMRIVRKYMQKAKTEISSYKSSVIVIDDVSNEDNEASLSDISVLDPLRKKGKGVIYERLGSSKEKKKKKSKKGTPPTPIGSRDYSSYSNQFHSAFHPSYIGGPTVNSNIYNQMQQSPYIMPLGIMSGFSPFPNQLRPPYVMPSGIMNGFFPFTNQMLEYNNGTHETILSQGSSNSFQHPGLNELNNSERTQTNGPK